MLSGHNLPLTIKEITKIHCIDALEHLLRPWVWVGVRGRWR